MELMELKHLDRCPECNGNVLMTVTIKESMMRDVNSEEKAGAFTFNCTGNPSHRYLLIPGKKIKRLKPVYKKETNKKTPDKAKKKTAKKTKSAKVKKSKAGKGK